MPKLVKVSNEMIRVDAADHYNGGCAGQAEPNTFGNWDKYIWQLGQVHFIIGTNTFSDWDKSGQTPIAISVPVTSRTQGHTPRSSKEGCSLRCFILRVSGNS